jgi:hypothetical protein
MPFYRHISSPEERTTFSLDLLNSVQLLKLSIRASTSHLGAQKLWCGIATRYAPWPHAGTCAIDAHGSHAVRMKHGKNADDLTGLGHFGPSALNGHPDS